MSSAQTPVVAVAILAIAAVVYWKHTRTPPRKADDMDFTKVERAILLHLIRHGDDVPANISESQGVHRNSVSRTASDLVDEGLIINKGHGVYQLTDDGSEMASRLAEIESMSNRKRDADDEDRDDG